MKHIFFIIFSLLIGLSSHSQKDSINAKEFSLTGKIISKVELPPHCGIIAWGTVIEFEVIDLTGMIYPNRNIGIIITCPEFYKENFFEKGKSYQLIFTDKNTAGFGWLVHNKELLKKNNLSFDPYVVSVKKKLGL